MARNLGRQRKLRLDVLVPYDAERWRRCCILPIAPSDLLSFLSER